MIYRCTYKSLTTYVDARTAQDAKLQASAVWCVDARKFKVEVMAGKDKVRFFNGRVGSKGPARL